VTPITGRIGYYPDVAARFLIASDASVRGLLGLSCAAREHGPGQIVCLAEAPDGPPPAQVAAAASAQAELFEHRFLEQRQRKDHVRVSRPGERQTRALLDLAFLGLRERVEAVVWAADAGTGAVGGADVGTLAGVLGRAELVERLVGLELPPDSEPLRVRVPYADLSDRQVADLVLDMDLPIWTCWWWALARGPRNVAGADVARVEYDRWEGLLKEAGWREGMPGPAVMDGHTMNMEG
jgi:hypothetical protein